MLASPQETTIFHLVKPEDLNHHGTLFAGQLARWLLESGLIAASLLVGKPEDIVCAHLGGMDFKKPVANGALVEIKSRIAHLGGTSLTVSSKVFVMNEETPVVSSLTVFVTVDGGNRPYEHGFHLSEEYIAENSEIHKEALSTRRRGTK